MPLYVSSTRAHRQEAKIVLYNLWYHHTETSEWSKITKITKITTLHQWRLKHFIIQQILIAFPRQQKLRERRTMSRYTYIVCVLYWYLLCAITQLHNCN